MRRNSKWAKDSEVALRRLSMMDAHTLQVGMSFLEEQKGDGEQELQQQREQDRHQLRRPRRPTFSAKKKRSSLVKEGRRRFTVKAGALADIFPGGKEGVETGGPEREGGEERGRGGSQVALLDDEESERRRREKKRTVQRATAFQQDMRAVTEEQARLAEAQKEDDGPHFDVMDFDFEDDAGAYDEEIRVGALWRGRE